MKKPISSTLLFFLVLFSVNAQNSITGTITDAYTIYLPFANIIMHKQGGDELPKGVISDDDGAYVFENIPNGNYQLEISVLGFEIKKSEEFSLTGNTIFNFLLEEEAQALNEVVVKSKRPVIKQTAEKLVVDFENSELINTSLQDVMRKVPGILVTNNGISIAGNRGVRILINGKTTEYMDIQTLLRDFPADNISKIEVVEQPGAEYEASGSGAIINIILKKNVRLGTHGNFTTLVGEDQGFEYSTGASIASYKNKLNWQASFNQSEPTWRDDLFLVRNVGSETYDQATREPYSPRNFRISGNIDYYINDKNIIGVGGRWNNRKLKRIAYSETIISDATETNTLFSENSFDTDRVDFNFNPYYEYKSDTDNDLQSFNENSLGSFDFNGDGSSQFLIDETIFALYSKINSTVGKWSFSGGVRYEDSNTDGSSIFLRNGALNSTVKKRPIKNCFQAHQLAPNYLKFWGQVCLIVIELADHHIIV